MSHDLRRYSDQEFARVLHRALRLQEERDSGRPRSPDGLTLEEIRAVARDVGIDVDLVDRAVALLSGPEPTGLERLLGGPTRYGLTRSLDRRLDREDLVRLVDAIRAETGQPGQVVSELDGITWETERGEVSRFHVSVQPSGGRTELRLSVNRDAAFIMTWFFSVAGGLVVAGVTGAAVEPATFAGGAALLGSGAAGGLALARALWGRSTAIVRARAEGLMDAIGRRLEEPESTGGRDRTD